MIPLMMWAWRRRIVEHSAAGSRQALGKRPSIRQQCYRLICAIVSMYVSSMHNMYEPCTYALSQASKP